MITLFAGGATTPLVVKISIKQPWVKIKFRATLIVIARYLEAKFDYCYFILVQKIVLKLPYLSNILTVPASGTNTSSI